MIVLSSVYVAVQRQEWTPTIVASSECRLAPHGCCVMTRGGRGCVGYWGGRRGEGGRADDSSSHPWLSCPVPEPISTYDCETVWLLLSGWGYGTYRYRALYSTTGWNFYWV